VAIARIPEAAPEEFTLAVTQLLAARLRPEIELGPAPAPRRAAPFATAFGAELISDGVELGSARFVLLHDPAGQDAWQGQWRVVSYVRATLDPEIAADGMLGQVSWTWLIDALEANQAGHHGAGGTVTRVISDSHGELADREPESDLEIRASWSPDSQLDRHLLAWADLLSQACGLPPLPSGVSSLPRPAR
jgi:hypothetical protein